MPSLVRPTSLALVSRQFPVVEHRCDRRVWAGRLLHGRHPCVLVTPEFPNDEEADARLVFGEVRTCVDPDEWRALLEEVRERNTGRRAPLSLAAGSTDGVASTDRGYVLLALEYDRRGDRVEIVLGNPQVVGSHLTHRITGIRRIDTVTEPDGGNARVEFDSRSGRCILDFIGD